LAVLVRPVAGQVTQRVSIAIGGGQTDSGSGIATISADGRFVAFASDATNLVPGDTNVDYDVFVRDRQLGTNERVNVDSGGAQANGLSGEPSISTDCRYVAFSSWATNLVPGDTNGFEDVFVRDRQLGTTERVSVTSGGVQGSWNSGRPSISADGRYVAFESIASNLVPGDTNGFVDVFVRDRQLGTTERVSVDSSGFQGNSDSDDPSISADGRYVAFESDATNLVPGDTNGFVDVFVRDRQLGTIVRVSVASGGAQANGGDSLTTSISADGRFVAFRSAATDLVPGDTNGFPDVFVHDRQLGATVRVSVDSAGAQANGGSHEPSVSADGRFVAFRGDATNLVAGDTNGFNDVFLRDRQIGATVRVSVDSAGAQGNFGSFSIGASISVDGRYVAFASAATNLVPGDTNGLPDVFVRDRGPAAFMSLCHPGVGGVISCPCGQPANPAGGCANFGAGSTSGAVLSGSGVASLSADTLVLTTSNHRMPAIGVLNVFFSYKPGSATPTTGNPSGAGVRCIGTGGDLRRLYTMQVFGGTGSKPGMGDPSVSARSASFLGHAISAGETRFYFNVYRDGQSSGPCGNTLTSTNLTNMGSIVWSP